MQVFKFGGASIRNALAIRNMADIIRNYGKKPLLIVVSAMGKTTRHLEAYINGVSEGKRDNGVIREIHEYHLKIMQELFQEDNPVFKCVEGLFMEAEAVPWDEEHYSKFYDKIFSLGEQV